MQIWIKAIFVFVSLFILLSLITFYQAIKPTKIVTNLIPSDLGLKYEEVSFSSKDGIKLNGWFLPNNKSEEVIVVMHGYPADKANLLLIAKFLNKDFNVFLFDFRSFGKSEGKYTTAGYLEKNDLLGVIEYLEKERHVTGIGLYGFSMGGAVSLMTSHQNIKAIITDSTYSKLENMVFHMYRGFYVFKFPLFYLTKLYGTLFLGINISNVNPIDDIKGLNVPILIIHAENDSQIPVGESLSLHNANKKSQLWIIKEADHGATYAINPEQYEKIVMDFFKRNLKNQIS